MIAQLNMTYLRSRPWKLWSRMLSYALFEGRPLTTRGRWINPLVSANISIAKKLPQLRSVVNPVFMLGTGRSGTTVLGMVLSMHRDVGYLNEPKAIWHAIHDGEDLIGNYSRENGRYRLYASEATQDRIKYAHRIYGAYLAASCSQRVLDKYPELVFRASFVKKLFPDAKFLFLIRDGRDTCHSIQSWSKRMGQRAGDETHDWWGVDRRKWRLLVKQLVPEHPDLAKHQEIIYQLVNQADMAAVEWIITMREGLSLIDSDPGNVMAVRFEELCRQPDIVLSKICSFLDLRNDDVFFAYGKKTLHSVPFAGTLTLHPILSGPFNFMLDKLGYV